MRLSAVAGATSTVDGARSGPILDRTVQQLAGALLLMAARRYPEPLRSELALEWTSELHAIIHDDDRSRFYRAYRALQYGVSLALTAALLDRPCQAGATRSGATRHRSGPIAAVIAVIAVIAAASIIRAIDAYATAVARDTDLRAAVAIADNEAAHTSVDVVLSPQPDACLVLVATTDGVSYDLHCREGYARLVSATAQGAVASAYAEAARAAAAEADRAAAAAVAHNDIVAGEAHDDAVVAGVTALAATVVFLAGYAIFAVRCLRARRRVLS